MKKFSERTYKLVVSKGIFIPHKGEEDRENYLVRSFINRTLYVIFFG